MFNHLVQKHTKSKLTKAISKLITKIGNLGLKIDMQVHVKLNSAQWPENHPKGFSKIGGRYAIQI